MKNRSKIDARKLFVNNMNKTLNWSQTESHNPLQIHKKRDPKIDAEKVSKTDAKMTKNLCHNA